MKFNFLYHSILTASLTLMLISASANAHQSPKAIVESLFKAFNNHDSLALAQHYSEDGVLISPETCAPIKGRDAIAKNYEKLFEDVPDVIDTVDLIVEEGNRIAVTFTAASKIAQFEMPIAAFLEIHDGKIIRDVAFFDAEVTPDCL